MPYRAFLFAALFAAAVVSAQTPARPRFDLEEATIVRRSRRKGGRAASLRQEQGRHTRERCNAIYGLHPAKTAGASACDSLPNCVPVGVAKFIRRPRGRYSETQRVPASGERTGVRQPTRPMEATMSEYRKLGLLAVATLWFL